MALALLAPALSAADDAARVISEPVLDPPTLHCLGLYWIVGGDENENSRVDVAWRLATGGKWTSAQPLFRVERGAHRAGKHPSDIEISEGAWLFAGSVVGLAPDTEYELRLALTDPDGGPAERRPRVRTLAEPVLPANDRRQYHVAPGVSGGSGVPDDPFRGLAAAQAAAQPGDVFLLHAGVYKGTFTVRKSGAPGKPIVWRAAGDGEAIIDGQGDDAKRPGNAIAAGDAHDVWFEGLTVRNGDFAIAANRSARLVIRRCHIYGCNYGITCTGNQNGKVAGLFIADNILEGPSSWPRTKGIENARGIQVTGAGHVVCYNRIRGFADGIDTFGSQKCCAIDFHNNDISEMTDDGIEMDYSHRNTRCFNNRLTNVYQGISAQPVHGGPVYIFRNTIYNLVGETFKLHNQPSGALMFHNTSVKKGMPLALWTGEGVRHCVSRNNIFIGTAGNYAYECTAPMTNCDFDHDGFGGGPWDQFLKWNGRRYRTLEQVKREAPVYRHAVRLDPRAAFADGAAPPSDEKIVVDAFAVDLRLKAGSNAIDAGAALPGFNDGFRGRGPDLGAFELGDPPPHYGPRPIK